MTNPIDGFDRSFGALQHTLGVALMRHRAIQSNLANANTPGYQRVEVKFESLLAERLEGRDLDADAIRSVAPRLVRDTSPGRADGNNVALEREYADMERNRLQFEAITEIVSLRIQGLRAAITAR